MLFNMCYIMFRSAKKPEIKQEMDKRKRPARRRGGFRSRRKNLKKQTFAEVPETNITRKT